LAITSISGNSIASIATNYVFNILNSSGNVLFKLNNNATSAQLLDGNINISGPTAINSVNHYVLSTGGTAIYGSVLANPNGGQYFASVDNAGNATRYMVGHGSKGLKIELTPTGTWQTSALLQVNSTTQGFLPPRMTTEQMYAISSPANGLEVYKTDGYQGKYVYMENEWLPIADGNELVWWSGNQGSNSIVAPMTVAQLGTSAGYTAATWTSASSSKTSPISLQTGTTTTGYTGLYTSITNLNNISTVGAKFCFRFVVITPTVLSNATDTYSMYVSNGVLNAGPAANTVGFYYTHGTNSGAWTCFWGAIAGSSASSGVIVATSTKYTLEIEFIIGTSIKYYINGVLVLTQTTGIPSALAAAYLASSFIVKSAGTTGVNSFICSILARRLI
jgi:hypothetical protein